jgi:hypothetical protein
VSCHICNGEGRGGGKPNVLRGDRAQPWKSCFDPEAREKEQPSPMCVVIGLFSSSGARLADILVVRGSPEGA